MIHNIHLSAYLDGHVLRVPVVHHEVVGLIPLGIQGIVLHRRAHLLLHGLREDVGVGPKHIGSLQVGACVGYKCAMCDRVECALYAPR